MLRPQNTEFVHDIKIQILSVRQEQWQQPSIKTGWECKTLRKKECVSDSHTTSKTSDQCGVFNTSVWLWKKFLIT